MPSRFINESICTDNRIDALTNFQEAFYFHLIVSCDDYGRMDARPRLLSSYLFPLRNIPESMVIEAVEQLKRVGLIDLIRIGNKDYIHITDWDKTQPNAGRKTPEYRKWRKQVLERDNHQCRMCGKKSRKLIAHHIRRYRNDISGRTDVSNGITLCEECHKMVHRVEGR